MHIFGYGEHGLGLGDGDPDYGEWCNLLQRWLRSTGLLTAAQRTGVSGRLTLDGEPMGMVWLTLVPEDDTAPIARVKFNSADQGAFEIDAAHGPVPGKHMAQVHYLSDQYPFTNTGAYTLDDVRSYAAEVEIVAGEHIVLAFES